MRFTSLIDRLRRRLRKLRTAVGANVTVTFSFALIPVVGFVGAAVDYSHANSIKVALQAALDFDRTDAVEVGDGEDRGANPDHGQRLLQGPVQPHEKVDGLYPSGNTNQGIGIAWAFQSLTASPFTIPGQGSRISNTTK